MGDKGRSKSSGGGATVSGAYFDFLFLKGAINSERTNMASMELHVPLSLKHFVYNTSKKTFFYQIWRPCCCCYFGVKS